MSKVEESQSGYSYTLYGDKGSGSATVELALAEIGVDVVIRDIQIDNNQQRDSDYAAVNPQRKLPTLITPEKETLTESAAILLTLAERHPDAGLLPDAGSPERAHAVRWLIFIAAELYPIIEIIDYPARFQPEGDTLTEARCEELRDHLRGIWRARWRLVEDAAEGDPWFLGTQFSLVDIYIAVISRWAQCNQWRSAKLERVEGIATAIGAREKTAMTWNRHFG